MNYATKFLCGALIATLFSQPASASRDCNGKFPNLVTDICWSCSFPIVFGSGAMSLPISTGQEDTPNTGGSPICACGLNFGIKISFWEPARHVDVVRKPFCLSAMGGVKINPGFDAPHGTQTKKDNAGMDSFYQAHWYIDPVMVLMQVLLDSPCLEQNVFDLTYLTEFDPLWNDDEMTTILNPDSFLFGNLISQLACGADCVASTIGFGSNTLFWCAGCQGSMYPLNGHVAAHVGGVQASGLIVSRLIAKMHREGLMSAASGDKGLCGYYPQFLMDKTNYKYQMHFPVAQDKINGKCCQPLGRSEILWGANKEFPNTPISDGGEDFSYMIFRKRTCCQGAF
ncbi:MAG: TraU family protein [Gallionella sp.]